MKESEQSRPVTLGSDRGESGVIRNRKTMAGTGVGLDQMFHSCLGQCLFQTVLLFFGK